MRECLYSFGVLDEFVGCLAVHLEEQTRWYLNSTDFFLDFFDSRISPAQRCTCMKTNKKCLFVVPYSSTRAGASATRWQVGRAGNLRYRWTVPTRPPEQPTSSQTPCRHPLLTTRPRENYHHSPTNRAQHLASGPLLLANLVSGSSNCCTRFPDLRSPIGFFRHHERVVIDTLIVHTSIRNYDLNIHEKRLEMRYKLMSYPTNTLHVTQIVGATGIFS
jgi:hypothetical protein